jgi:serine protease Do
MKKVRLHFMLKVLMACALITVGTLLAGQKLATAEDALRQQSREEPVLEFLAVRAENLVGMLKRIFDNAGQFSLEIPTGDELELDMDVDDPRISALRKFYQAQLERRRPSRNSKDHRNSLEEYKPVVADARKVTAIIRDPSKRGQQVAFATVVSKDGYLVSKASELPEGAIICELADGRKVDAKRLDTEEAWDMALLKVDVDNLDAARLGEGNTVELGTFLAAPGTGQYPVAIGVASVAPRNLSQENRGFLGIGMENRSGGVRVREVQPDSAAAKAGLEKGDIIFEINDRKIDAPAQLAQIISSSLPGDEVNIRFRRGEDERGVTVVLGLRPVDRREREGSQFGGVLSEKRSNFPNALQHDLTLHPNECGGPLVDLDGEVVGVNIARGGRVKSYAIPAGDLKDLLSNLELGRFRVADTDAQKKKSLETVDEEIKGIERRLERARKRRKAIERATELRPH